MTNEAKDSSQSQQEKAPVNFSIQIQLGNCRFIEEPVLKEEKAQI
jgi:hypothetical protein